MNYNSSTYENMVWAVKYFSTVSVLCDTVTFRLEIREMKIEWRIYFAGMTAEELEFSMEHEYRRVAHTMLGRL